MRRITMWALALAAGWLMNTGLGWSADAPTTGMVLGTLHHSNLKQISMARVGQRDARTRQIKDFADMLVDDNGAADRKIVALARQEGVDLDATTPRLNPSDVASLREAVDFDATFVKVLHDDQEDDLAQASAAYDATKDARLRALLGEIIPTMRAHRDMAKIIIDQGAPRASL